MMRVISGEYKGYQLSSLKGNQLRPTSDRVKEALFSILSNRIEGSLFLDLFSGTGNVGIEAVSRGAQHTTFVESNPKHFKILQKNVEKCGIKNKITVYQGTAHAFIKEANGKKQSFTVIFLDPPYFDHSKDLLLDQTVWGDILHQTGYLIVEHFYKNPLEARYQTLQKAKEYRYGDSVLTFFEVCS